MISGTHMVEACLSGSLVDLSPGVLVGAPLVQVVAQHGGPPVAGGGPPAQDHPRPRARQQGEAGGGPGGPWVPERGVSGVWTRSGTV